MASAATAATAMTAAAADEQRGAAAQGAPRAPAEQPAAFRLGGLVGDPLGAGEVGGRAAEASSGAARPPASAR